MYVSDQPSNQFHGPMVLKKLTVSQETPRLLWNPVHKSLTLVPVLNKMNLVHIFVPCFFKMRS